MSTTEQTGRPGKYQRSAFGLIVALVTTVVLIAVVMWLMSLFRHKTEVKPPHVDYRSVVADAQEGGLTVVYPASLPTGYFATQATVPTDGDGFEIDLLDGDAADSDYIGVVEAKSSLPELVQANVQGAHAGSTYVVGDSAAHPLARNWAVYRGSGGNAGYAAKVGSLNVVVYGQAPAQDMRQVVDSLTEARLPRPGHAQSKQPSKRPSK